MTDFMFKAIIRTKKNKCSAQIFSLTVRKTPISGLKQTCGLCHLKCFNNNNYNFETKNCPLSAKQTLAEALTQLVKCLHGQYIMWCY